MALATHFDQLTRDGGVSYPFELGGLGDVTRGRLDPAPAIVVTMVQTARETAAQLLRTFGWKALEAASPSL